MLLVVLGVNPAGCWSPAATGHKAFGDQWLCTLRLRSCNMARLVFEMMLDMVREGGLKHTTAAAWEVSSVRPGDNVE